MKQLIIAGLAADNCLLFTAHDAYLRGLKVVIAQDAVASQRAAGAERALAQMKSSLKAKVLPVDALQFEKVKTQKVINSAK